jgi:3-oxosteroid 1-dehydrogenase
LSGRTTQWDETVDFLIVGSGGGSMCAALACVDEGLRPLILEKTDKVGGSTAMSGGILWIPVNPLLPKAGVRDSYEQARTYLSGLTPDQPGSTPARKDAYLRTGPKMIEWLQAKGVRFVYCDGWSDYYDDQPGGQPRGRSLTMALFDIRRLGAWKDRLRRNAFPLPAHGFEARRLALMLKTWSGLAMAVRVGLRITLVRLLGRELVANGAAIQAWMLHASIKAGVDIRTGSPVRELIQEQGRVVGVVAQQGDREVRIRATRGVLVDAGGFARNAEMRKAYGPQPSSIEWTSSNPGDTGEMLQAMMGLGAATHGLDRAIWCVSSIQPSGQLGVHANELAKPHVIVVDRQGQRFTNEAASYMETGQKVYAHNAVPCFAIMDGRHRATYNWAHTPPRLTPSEWISSGYMKRSATIEDLARQCGIDPAGLKQTIERFNGFARAGKDEDFHRGDRAYDRHWGDPTYRPNPSLGELSTPPFYAVELYPGDVGTYGGVVADEFGRVLDKDGAPLPGLYATGNCTAGVTGACYPGAGASIGASFIFGYRAARHAAGVNEV